MYEYIKATFYSIKVLYATHPLHDYILYRKKSPDACRTAHTSVHITMHVVLLTYTMPNRYYAANKSN